MDLEDFRHLDRKRREEDPSIFELGIAEPPASEDQICAVENLIGTGLPDSYRMFLREFGGGTYGLVVVFCANPESDWYLPTQQECVAAPAPGSAIVFSDDFAGGSYYFKVIDGKASNEVFYWHQDDGECPTGDMDVYEFIARHAYTA